MKIAFSADWHIGVSTHSLNKIGIPSRTQDSISAVRQIIDKAKSLDCECFIVGGDIFHHANPKPHFILEGIKLLQLASDVFQKLFVISGNHDPKPLSNEVGVIGLLSRCSGLNVSDFYESDADGTHKNCFNYSVRPYQKKIFNINAPIIHNKKLPTIIIAHHHFQGAVVGSEAKMLAGGVSLMEDGIGKNLILSGHIHKPQHIKLNSGGSVLYPGSPARFDFSDRKDPRGFWVIEILNNKIDSFKFVEIECRKMIQIERSKEWFLQTDEECLKDLEEVKGADVKTILYTDDVLDIELKRMEELLKKAGAYYFTTPKIKLTSKNKVKKEKAGGVKNNYEYVDLWLKNNDLGQFSMKEIKESALKVMSNE